MFSTQLDTLQKELNKITSHFVLEPQSVGVDAQLLPNLLRTKLLPAQEQLEQQQLQEYHLTHDGHGGTNIHDQMQAYTIRVQQIQSFCKHEIDQMELRNGKREVPSTPATEVALDTTQLKSAFANLLSGAQLVPLDREEVQAAQPSNTQLTASQQLQLQQQAAKQKQKRKQGSQSHQATGNQRRRINDQLQWVTEGLFEDDWDFKVVTEIFPAVCCTSGGFEIQ